MIIKNEIKKEIIDYIDQMEVQYEGYIKQYTKELKKYRDKYIYKEVGYYECKSDVDAINQIKRKADLSKMFWEEL
jgi:hypothetical protein